MNDFKDYNDLYQYITKMSENTYLEYLEEIYIYISSEKIKPFTDEYFAETIVNEITKTLNNKL